MNDFKKLMMMWVAALAVGCAGVPKPTGALEVGTKTWVATHDAGVVDVLVDGEQTGPRRLPVKAWFPATGGGFEPANNPVLVFVHGTGSELDAHSAVYSELASRGWVVLESAHPGLARTADYPDGPSRAQSTKLSDVFARVNGGSLSMADAFADPYLVSVVELLQADVRLILTSATTQLPGVSVDRVSYGGHSMGAVVTMRLCRQASSNCVAFVNLDGPPLADVTTDADGSHRLEAQPMSQPTLVVTSSLMAAGAKTKALWSLLDAQAQLGTAPTLQVQLQNAGHLDLTDAPVALGHVLQGVLFGENSTGSIDPVAAVQETRDVVATFLERFGACRADVDLSGSLGGWKNLVVQYSRGLESQPVCQ